MLDMFASSEMIFFCKCSFSFCVFLLEVDWRF